MDVVGTLSPSESCVEVHEGVQRGVQRHVEVNRGVQRCIEGCVEVCGGAQRWRGKKSGFYFN